MPSLIKAYEDGTLAAEQRQAREANPFPRNLRINWDTYLDNHPEDGRDWECQCARCGSSIGWNECEGCGGTGETEPGELYDQDPMWYDFDDTERCSQCSGEASFPFCLSTEAWCKEHPLEGRETVESGRLEWFCVGDPNHE